MSELKKSIKKAERRAFRVRQSIRKRSDLPRISVFRSLKHIYAQLIDDAQGKTLASSSTLQVDAIGNKKEQAQEVGRQLAELAKKANIDAVVFDRGSYRYHGRIEALAQGLRDGGLLV